MEEFVAEIKNNIGKDDFDNCIAKKSTRLKEILSKIINSDPEVAILNSINEDGDVQFEVSLRSVNVSAEIINKYRSEISTDFAANFIGEFIVRENVNKFVGILTGLRGNYASIVNKFEHRRFGMKIFCNKFVFTFHVSLLQNILFEDFKRVSM